MELAHACEDVLHGLRKTSTPPDNNIRQHLLEAVDWIKKQLSVASPGNYPKDVNQQLLESLAPFRLANEESDESNPLIEKEISSKKESATEQISEEKEALAVDTLRIQSHSLDNLLTYINTLATKVNEQTRIIDDKTTLNYLKEARKNIQKIKSRETEDWNYVKKAFDRIKNFKKDITHTDASILSSVTNIQKVVLDLRIISLSTIFNKLPRIVRQKAAQSGKQVQLITEGGDVLIDKGMVEIISEPLIHLLHNAIIHGIETSEERQECNKSTTSQISVIASEKNNILKIEVIDDGKGIDFLTVREKAIRKGFAKQSDDNDNPAYWLKFLFLHGLNSENINRVTGLDIVKEQLANIGGEIEIESSPGIGTRFIMRMPVTVAIQSSILVRSQNQTFAFSARNIIEISEVRCEEADSEQGILFINLRGKRLPVYKLATILGMDKLSDKTTPTSILNLLIVRSETNCIAISIDDVIGRRELFLRDIHQDIRKIPGIYGISLLGNGDPVIILDCEEIFRIVSGSINVGEAAYGS
jgi:two-component system chemotaxis sensor kinase CheA